MQMIIEYNGRKMIIEDQDLQERIWGIATGISLSREGKQWLPNEDELLLKMIKEKRQFESIATVLERKADAVKQRAYIIQKKNSETYSNMTIPETNDTVDNISSKRLLI